MLLVLFRVFTHPGKSLIFSLIFSMPWKVMQNQFGPGKSWELTPRVGSGAL